MNSASTHYPNTEGIAYHNSTLYFVSKVLKRMFNLNLDDMTHTFENTGSKFDGQGSFIAQPDQIKFHDKRKFIYFTEDGGSGTDVHARDSEGKYYTLFRGIPGGQYSGDYLDEGVLFEITREDGQMLN